MAKPVPEFGTCRVGHGTFPRGLRCRECKRAGDRKRSQKRYANRESGVPWVANRSPRPKRIPAPVVEYKCREPECETKVISKNSKCREHKGKKTRAEQAYTDATRMRQFAIERRRKLDGSWLEIAPGELWKLSGKCHSCGKPILMSPPLTALGILSAAPESRLERCYTCATGLSREILRPEEIEATRARIASGKQESMERSA